MNTEKEKQHYVPKFYLRNFSFHNNKKQIGVFNTKTEFFIDQAKLKTQAYRPYYYGKTGEIEDWLSKIEGKLSPISSDIINTRKLPQPNSEEHELLLLFLILTELRNPVISNTISNNRKELIRRVKEIIPNNPNVETEIPEMTKEQIVRMALSGIKTGIKYCKDLQAKLLINSTKTPFITSDNPLSKYNQFLEARRWFGGWTGYASLGLQLFFPIDPELTVMVYDGWTYRLGDRKKGSINVNEEDVNQLNILQILNCESNVFFNELATKEYLDKIFKYSQKFSKSNQMNSYVLEKIDDNGKIVPNNKVVSLGTTNPSINLKLGNCSFTKHAKKHHLDGRAVQMRPAAITIYERENQSRG